MLLRKGESGEGAIIPINTMRICKEAFTVIVAVYTVRANVSVDTIEITTLPHIMATLLSRFHTKCQSLPFGYLRLVLVVAVRVGATTYPYISPMAVHAGGVF